jgi:hypothetical protein
MVFFCPNTIDGSYKSYFFNPAVGWIEKITALEFLAPKVLETPKLSSQRGLLKKL